MFIASMFGFHISSENNNNNNNFLIVFPSAIFYLNIKKKFLFLKQIVMGNEKQIL